MNASASTGGSAASSMNTNAGYKRIASEEAFAFPELLKRYRTLLDKQPTDDPGFSSLWGFFLGKSERAIKLVSRIQDLGEGRIHDMNESGIAKQVISLTAPGVQVFDAATATSLATSSNDQLAEAVRKYPERFAGLTAIAPQDPRNAAKELERGVKALGLKGAILNSHTRGEYLDDPKFWEIFESAEALNVPIYLHPNTPSPAMVGPFLKYKLDGAIYGFAVETGLHMLRIIVSGAFDRFPGLKIVVGHLGEAIPYWLFRIDFMHRLRVLSGTVEKLNKKPSDYVRENFYVTTSGMAWEPAIMFAHSVLGADRVLYAMDYPYQYVPEEVKVTDDLPLSDPDKKKLYQLNAERVFSL
jgi:2,3-dihydroxybenzoate decarboxylase